MKFRQGGRGSLAQPLTTGSLSRSMPTIRIVAVAFVAARIAFGLVAKITSHLLSLA